MIGNQRVNKILCRNVLKTNKKIRAVVPETPPKI